VPNSQRICGAAARFVNSPFVTWLRTQNTPEPRSRLSRVDECLGDDALTEITATAKRVEVRFVLASCVRLWPLFVYSS
jgi:hypothetical protein